MTRQCLLSVVLAGALGLCPSLLVASELLSEPEVAQHGMTRPWCTQAQVDPVSGRVTDVVFDDGTLFVLTDQAVLQAIDALTGRTLWWRQVGRLGMPCVTPVANSRMVATANGSQVYVFNRFNGKLLFESTLEGMPIAGPALSEERVYIPLCTGLLASYRLKELKEPPADPGKGERPPATPEQETEHRESFQLDPHPGPPLSFQSVGHTFVPPVVTRQTPDEEFVAWVTDKGYMSINRIDRHDHKKFDMLYRLKTEAPITAQPTYLPAPSWAIPALSSPPHRTGSSTRSAKRMGPIAGDSPQVVRSRSRPFFTTTWFSWRIG